MTSPRERLKGMDPEPPIPSGKQVYHLYHTHPEERGKGHWVLMGQNNSRATAKDKDYQSVKNKTNDLLGPNSSALAVVRWEPSSRGEWVIKEILVNRGIDLDGRSVSATNDRIRH